MTGFLTVEDIDGCLYRNQSFYWQEIDTANISSTSDFDYTKYDFCEVKRETGTFSGKSYRYTFKIYNNYFTKGFYILKQDGSKLTSYTRTFVDDVFTILTDEPVLRLFLYMGVVKYDDASEFAGILVNEELFLSYKELNTSQTLKFVNLSTHQEQTLSRDVTVGINNIRNGIYTNFGFLFVHLVKSDFQFQCNQSVTVGKVNKVQLGTSADYKPSGDMVGTYTPSISVDYNGTILPVAYDGSDYSFNLDLTDKTEAGKVRFKVLVEANDVLNASETEVVLNSQYQTVSTFNNLVTACSDNGTDIIRLGSNLTATSNILIQHSIKIIGNDKTLNLNGYKFILDEDVTFNAENISFNNGDTTIIQAKNTKVELTGCTFNNCTSSNYNGLGSCIFCDVDVDSLNVTNDYITILTDCTFTNNSNCILHGGELTITGCTLNNDDTTNINTNNVAFVYQTDGTCLIQQSTFNIDYDYTSQEANIGFAQALIMCGETANINGAIYTELGDNNTLLFFEAPFNNRADLTAKYYYPQISDNVESIGTVEHKACCHAVSGVDWVFKDNVTVRRLE